MPNSSGLLIENMTMSGEALDFQTPAGTTSLAIQALGGDLALTLYDTPGTYTIKSGSNFTLSGSLATKTLLLEGATGSFAQIFYQVTV